MFADTKQEGLFNSLDWIRSKLGVKYDKFNQPYGEPGSIAAGVLCPYCSSIWFGVIFAMMYILNTRLTFYFTLPFALSAVAILIEEKRSQ